MVGAAKAWAINEWREDARYRADRLVLCHIALFVGSIFVFKTLKANPELL